MATNAERAEALRVAIATGVKSVTVEGITTTFQDTSEMLDALALFEGRAAGEAAVAAGSVPTRRVAYAYSKGLSA